MKIKTAILTAALSLAPAAMLCADEVREVVTTSSGVVSDAEPDALVVTGENAPVHYSFTKTTRYFDEDGNPVRVDVIKKGMPVTVQYVRQGDALVASRVVVRTTPAASEVTTTTTTVKPGVEVSGTVTELRDGAITLRTPGSGHPVRYGFTGATRWVDAEGNAVTADIVNRGTPVTVVYTQNGDRADVAKIIVHKSPVIIEKKTTTTTTTEETKDKEK